MPVVFVCLLTFSKFYTASCWKITVWTSGALTLLHLSISFLRFQKEKFWNSTFYNGHFKSKIWGYVSVTHFHSTWQILYVFTATYFKSQCCLFLDLIDNPCSCIARKSSVKAWTVIYCESKHLKYFKIKTPYKIKFLLHVHSKFTKQQFQEQWPKTTCFTRIVVFSCLPVLSSWTVHLNLWYLLCDSLFLLSGLNKNVTSSLILHKLKLLKCRDRS